LVLSVAEGILQDIWIPPLAFVLHFEAMITKGQDRPSLFLRVIGLSQSLQGFQALLYVGFQLPGVGEVKAIYAGMNYPGLGFCLNAV
jgi:hypothetical protein